MKRAFFLLLAGALGYLGTAGAQVKAGEENHEFPPGVFVNSSGQKYRLADLKGKVVVLYFYDGTGAESSIFAPNVKDAIRKLKDQPVKFIAVAANSPPAAAANFARANNLSMPIFADTLGLMQKRFDAKVAGEKTVRFVVIGPDGLVRGNDWFIQSSGPKNYLIKNGLVEKTVEDQKVDWKYNPKDYDAKLQSALQAFEWNRFEEGMKLLDPFRKSKTKSKAKEAAGLLYTELKKEGEAWKEEADKAAEEKPITAYDLYTRVEHVFKGDELAKDAAAARKKLLETNKAAISKELAARKDMTKLEAQLATMSVVQRAQAVVLCKALAKRHPGTPTAEQAQALAAELAP